MKKKLTSIIICCSMSMALVLSPAGDTVAQAKAAKVYYVPGSSYAYHSSKRCRALSRSKNIKKRSVKKAKRAGLKPCKICY